MKSLILHPDCVDGPINSISASLAPTSKGFDVEYRVAGDLARVRFPEHEVAERTDGLWKATCFEVFWQGRGETAYREFNLSPSSRWASYAFTATREGMSNAPVDGIAIACSRNDREFILKASVATSLPLPATAGLTSVIELENGDIQYWALAHPAGKPDFHHACGRTIELETFE